MTDSSAALRTAVANLHPRERRAMRHECATTPPDDGPTCCPPSRTCGAR